MAELSQEMKNLKSFSENEEMDFMSDMNNWVCVHATKYEPKRNDAGQFYIETNAMAQDYKFARGTVHFTLNSVVHAHSGGNWDDVPTVILTPFNDMVKQNVEPQLVSVDDTYFIPNPDTGMVLPDSAYIIRTGETEKLFELGEHSAVYKGKNYTPGEIDEILSFDYMAKEYYEYLSAGDFSKRDVELLLHYDKKLMAQYEEAEDKKSFLLKYTEPVKERVIKKALRDMVVKISLGKMGVCYTSGHDGNDIARRIAEVAVEAGLKGDASDKGHSNSLEAKMEEKSLYFHLFLEDLKNENSDKIYDALVKSPIPLGLRKKIIEQIISPDKKLDIDIYSMFERYLQIYAPEYKDVADYNSNLSTVLHRYSDRALKKLEVEFARLEKNKELTDRLNKYYGDLIFDDGKKNLEDKLFRFNDVISGKVSEKLW